MKQWIECPNKLYLKLTKMSFSISARSKEINIVDYLSNFEYKNIDSVFGFTQDTTMYGGRQYNGEELSEQDLEWMYSNNIGYRIPLTNIYADEKDYEASRSFLEKHHRKGNSIILANTNLVQKFRDEFPLYELESSVIINPKTIQQIEDLQSIFDTVVLHGQWNISDKLLDIKDKDRIRLFAQMGCSLNCPNRTCYKYFSEVNSMRPILHSSCSQSFIERENLGFIEFNIKELESKGFSKFKVLRNKGTTGY